MAERYPGPMNDGSDVQLTVTTPAGPILTGSLAYLALHARAFGEGLPFTYRDPVDPEDPEAERPLRRARLTILDEGLVPVEGATLAGDGSVHHTEE
jgi:hypothetical protein